MKAGKAAWSGVLTFLRGVGQIVFQEDPVTGLCFLVGVALNSAFGAAAMLLGSVLGTVTAQVFGFREGQIKAGLFGFNGALVGVGVVAFFGATPVSVAMIVVGAPASALVMRGMQRLPFPPYTAPFVVVTWVLCAAGDAAGVPAAAPMVGPTGGGFAGAMFAGIGQIMFQESILSGAIFLAGIIWCARTAGAWACAGTAVGGGLWILLGCDPKGLGAGLAGYNAALVGVALASERPRWVLPLAGCAATVPFMLMFRAVGIPALTAPFVLASWVALMVASMLPVGRSAPA